jgi:hypothetical protein
MDKMDECCPKFTDKDFKAWDGKLRVWKNKRFIKGRVFSVFFAPINFGQVIGRMFANAQKSKAKVLGNLCLSEHSSRWNMDIYLAVDKKVEGEENVKLSGRFLSKVYEGDFKDTGKWCKDFEEFANKKKAKIKRWLMWYTTCPKCAKKYGKNYTVIIAQI